MEHNYSLTLAMNIFVDAKRKLLKNKQHRARNTACEKANLRM